jgi:O-antigen/teichoic acid export membrane protein
MDQETNKTQLIFRQVVINTISNYAGKIVTLGLWFFLTPFVLNRLGPSLYGMWILVGSLISYGSLLDFGIANAITKYIAEYYGKGDFEQAHSLIATALWFYTVVGLAAILLGAIFAPISPYVFHVPADQHATFSWLVFLSGIGLGLSLPCATPIAILRGLQRFDLINLIGIVGMLLFAASTVVVLLLGGGALGMVTVNILVNLVMQVPAIWLIRRNARELHFGWSGAKRSHLRMVASFSSALFVINIAGQLQAKTDEIVVGAFLPVSNVTPYSIAHRLSDIPQMLTEQFMKVLMPLASQLHAENDQRRLRQLYIISTRLTLASFLPLGLGVILLAKPFLTAWVGIAYAPYAGLVLLLVCASLFDTLMWPASSILQGMARHRLLAISAIASGLLNLAISVALVRPLGLAGVALGTLIPTILECLFFVTPYSIRVVGISLRTALQEIFLPILAPSISMGLVLMLLRSLINPTAIIPILAVGGLGLLAYVAVYFSIGASAQEKQMFRGLASNALRSTWERLRPKNPTRH